MRVVEVRVIRADFADALGKMREWLDQNGRPLVRLETESDSSMIKIKVQFEIDALAEAFRQFFRGSYAD